MKINGQREAHDTPCQGICTATALGDAICKGCGRTAEEVLNWNLYSVEEKLRIKAQIKDRIKTNEN